MRDKQGIHAGWPTGLDNPADSQLAQGSPRRRTQLLLPAVPLIAAGFAMAPTPASADIQNLKVFEWSMPDRLLVNEGIVDHDPDDPIPQYDPAALMLPPGGWTVNFDACQSSSSGIERYEWFVDGGPVATSANCKFSHQFPEEYRYRVSLRLTDELGASATVEETITVQDWLIIAVGDSYGSGEGNPERPVTKQLNVDFSVLAELASSLRSDLQAARDQLPGREEARQAAEQLNSDLYWATVQAQTDLNRAKQDLQEVVEIYENVESYWLVSLRRDHVEFWQQEVNKARAKVKADQQDYDNCSGKPFSNCGPAEKAARFLILTASKEILKNSNASLAVAELQLRIARNAAVAIYSTIASIQNFVALVQARPLRETAVNLKQNAFNAAQNAYANASAALQQAIDAVASLQAIITSLQNAWDHASLNFQTRYLDHLPVWTSTPPSWGTPEPTFAEIVLNGATPGDALRCHRSMISGQARAALALEQADPHSSVTLVHLSCSGATIADGLTGPYEGGEDFENILDPLLSPGLNPRYTGISFDRNANKIAAQIDDAATKIEGRPVDALLVSIGGNDIGFAGIIENCIGSEPCHLDLPPSTDFNDELRAAIEENCRPATLINLWTGSSLPSGSRFPFSDKCLAAYDLLEAGSGDIPRPAGVAKTTFETNIVELPGYFSDLAEEIGSKLMSLDSRHVYLTEYPNPTGGDDGSYCGWDPSQPPSGEGFKSLPGVTLPEIEWADTVVASALRNGTADASAKHGWTFVSATGEVDPLGGPAPTIGSVSKSHGYCANDHWIIRIPETLTTQQQISGVMHPNRDGHGLYRTAIFNQLLTDLYPFGIDPTPGDIDGDGDIDIVDIQAIIAARNTTAISLDDPRDLNGDGWIGVPDARIAVTKCTRSRCAVR